MLSVIEDRRSIRKYRPDPVPEEALRQILRAGMLAPSAKNRQPWNFVVVRGSARAPMLDAMRRGLERENRRPFLPGSARHLPAAEHTLHILEQAPAAIFAVNPLGLPFDRPFNEEDRVYELCNAQSLGAAMENMCLAAAELGLGSLWICDIYFAYRELQAWLDRPGELAAALALGYAAESPAPRPRRSFAETVEWRG